MATTQHTDSGSGRARRAPERTCVVTRTVAVPADLIRFVVGPDETVVPDIAQKLPGRGVWVGNRRRLIETAVKKNSFSRSFKRKVTCPQTLADAVEAQLERYALQAMSMANKAGQARTGYDKVDGSLATGDLQVLIQACDAAPDGRRRLAAKFVGLAQAAGRTPHLCELFSAEQLSLALGRANVVHAGLRYGSATTFFIQAAERLMRFRSNASFPVDAEPSIDRETSPAMTDARVAGRKTGLV